MSLEEKFHAAVNVIRSLPKSGSYQPSNEMMLRFYSYYKQATEGPCTKDKPGFWDVVNRAKWEAWNKLGDMSAETAMRSYVDELHKIVETMSYNSDVASFLSVGDDEQGFPSADLELVAGDVLARCRDSQHTSPAFSDDEQGFPSADLELVAGDVLARCRDSQHTSPAYSRSVSGASSPVHTSVTPPRTRHDSEDEFIDTVDVTVNEPEIATVTAPRLSNGHAHQITSQLTHLKVLEQLPGALARLEADVAALRKAVEGDRRILDEVSRGWRWPWQELSPPTMILMVVWPFIAFRIASRLQRRHT